MTTQKGLICFGIMLFCIQKTPGCFQRNISCDDVRTTDGFNFAYTCSEGAEISVEDNKTMIAHRKRNNSFFNYSTEVKSIDNHFVITRECRDLHVTCITLDKGGYLNEACEHHKVTEGEKTSYSPEMSVTVTTGIIMAIGIIVAIGITALIIFRLWKKKLRDHDRGGLNEVITNGENRESGSAENSENDVEQDNTLHRYYHSIDPKAEGKTQSHSLDHTFNNKEIQPSKNGDLSAPNINGACDHRAMHRNTRDDPGGVNDSSVRDVVGLTKRQNGWAPGDQGEGQPLLVTQRTAIQGFDEASVGVTGEAAVLVDKLGFDQDPIRRCSIAPDTDVESTSKHGDT